MGRLRPRIVSAVVVALVATGVTAATALGAQTNFTGSVSAGGTVSQTFSFAVSSPGQVSATMQWTTPSAVLTLAIVDPSGKQVALNSSNANPKTVTYNATITGTYKVRVKAKSGSSSYTGSATYPGVSVPQYAGQVGGGASGHAEIYPSGLTVGPDGTVYVADTGNDQVKAYAPTGAVLWTVGTRGSRTSATSATRVTSPTWTATSTSTTPATTVCRCWTPPRTPSPARGRSSSRRRWASRPGWTAPAQHHPGQRGHLERRAVFTPGGTFKCTINVPGLAGKAAQPRDAATDATATCTSLPTSTIGSSSSHPRR